MSTKDSKTTKPCTLQNVRQSALDYIETLSEELNLNGFDVKVVQRGLKIYLEMDTIAGKMTYTRAFDNIIKDYYRFIRTYGSKLATWALNEQHSA